MLKHFTLELHHSILQYYGPYTKVASSAGTNPPYASLAGLSISRKQHFTTSGMRIQD